MVGGAEIWVKLGNQTNQRYSFSLLQFLGYFLSSESLKS